ncbi:MAG: anthranilate synthase component I [Firmicutes bacterium]|nr:anthranilate synthase component I [Bacillota bacterium]
MQVLPDRREFHYLAREANVIPVSCEILADLETPVSIFQKTADTSPSFILESVERGERLGRYSFIGNEPFLIIKATDEQMEISETTPDGRKYHRSFTSPDPLAEVQKQLDRFRPAYFPGLPPFTGGAVGYIGYDSVRFCEPILKHNFAPAQGLDVPDIYLMFTEHLFVFDHVRHTVRVIISARVDGDPDAAYNAALHKLNQLVQKIDFGAKAPLKTSGHTKTHETQITSNFTQAAFEASVLRAKECIRSGDIFQVVLSQRLARKLHCHPFDLYRALRTVNPSPYLFYLDCGDLQLVGSSPESHVKVEDNVAELRPIAGTRRRGQTKEEDEALAKELLADEKERAEHIMLVDLARNDLGRISEYGSVQVTDFLTIERYSHVIHIVSSVQGKLRPGVKPVEVLKATFPAGTVSGAPKIRAIQIISELEPTRRGPYSGVVGYIDFTGNLDLCITIRTITVKDGYAYVQAGAGIVADSDPTREYEETLNKAKGMLVACDQAERRMRT